MSSANTLFEREYATDDEIILSFPFSLPRIVRNSLDPPFKQTFRVVLPDQFPDTELKVQVWDWDRFDEDDHMGDATVMVTSDGIIGGTLNGGYGVFATTEGGRASTEYLTNAKGEKSLVHLSFHYFPSSSNGDHSETMTATTDATPLFI
jgi:Ca2+-dependent lipid-binding protein